MTDKPKQETAVTQLAPRRMQLAEHAFVTWHVTSEAGTPVEALLDPKYWANAVHSHPINRGHRIEVDCEDGSYTATLFVREVGRLFAKVTLLSKTMLGASDAADAVEVDGYTLKYRGTIMKWTVTRIADKKTVSEGHENKDAARDWLREHLKALAA